MERFLAGVAAAVLLMGAGFLLWRGWQQNDLPPPPKLAARGLDLPILGDAMAQPPAATEKTREEKRFNRYDKDKNEEIAAEEYFASRRKAFAKLDVDRDGRLSFDEWSIKTREKFAKADADRSGKLNRTEFATTAVVRKVKPKPDCPPARPVPEEEES
ncbi:EF-hand domain-containing protein [Sphingomonas colocasiae]|uniref:Histidine kinase n=1 Tax=Sphingomonas colocasiae TaxID=1848973 RepID=A0ABS7PHJ9_9SPHN|nr:EF-hand domain-containing protein [Sphingomonas colocasiae]MBY8820693.1 histidine kinase [Sphingomonas colocasiae]